MIKFLTCVFMLLFFVSCSGYEFVYDKKPKIKEMYEKTEVLVYGDDTPLAVARFNRKVGKVTDRMFLITANIIKTSTPLVIEKDGTVSKQEIKHVVEYKLLNQKKNCLVVERKIITQNSYDKTSSGYNFGADLSKEDIIRKSLVSNIDTFFDLIISSIDIQKCANEG